MRKKEFFIVVMLLLIPSVWHVAFAQSGDFSFTADRPGVATGTDVLNKGLFQWEVGAAYDRTDNDGAVMHGYTFCNSLFRYGLTNTAELRLELNGVYEHRIGCPQRACWLLWHFRSAQRASVQTMSHRHYTCFSPII